MNFTHYDLGSLERGRYVRVTLEGNAANVLLLDDGNYQNYAAGQPYHYIGGLVQRSPVHFQTPQAGHWHISVNLDGLGGSVRAGVTLLYPKAGMSVPNLMVQPKYNPGQNLPTAAVQPSPVPAPYAPAPPVPVPAPTPAPAPAPAPVPAKASYNAFICYVTADKEEVARPLATYLTQRGVNVGFEEFELKPNTSFWGILDRSMDCNYGIFIISKNFIDRDWPPDQLTALAMKFYGSKPIIFPIWHKVSEWEIHLFSREIAKKPARWTGLRSLEHIADDLAASIPH